MPRKNSTAWAAGNPVLATRLEDFNEDIDDLYTLGSDRLKVYRLSTDPAFQVRIGAGTFRVGGAEGQYAGGTLTVGASETTYVMLNSSGVLQTSTSGWNAQYVKLGVVVSGASTITSITQWRNDAVGGVLGGLTFDDTRAAATTPNDYNDFFLKAQLKNLSAIGLDSIASGTYARLIGGRGWSDSSGGYSFELAYTNSGVFYRDGATTTWNSWKKQQDFNMYGDGSDGDVTVSTTITLTRDMQYGKLTVSSGGIINTNGYRIFARQIINNGVIQDNGNDGSGATGGTAKRVAQAGGNGGVGASNSAGGGGGIVTATQLFWFISANGGTGGNGGNGYNGTTGGIGGGSCQPNTTTGEKVFGTSYELFRGVKEFTYGLGGGGGGGGTSGLSNIGGNGGGGGGGGGLVFCIAMDISGNGVFRAKGGNGSVGGNYQGGNASGGGGGGGGGGGLIFLFNSREFAGTFDTSGGTGGGPGIGSVGTPTSGTSGSAGLTIRI